MDNISKQDFNEKFNYKGHDVTICSVEGRVELAIDGKVHEVRFLENGRPYTSAYVNVMATSVRDYAERFISFTIAQEAHWAKVDEERAKFDSFE